MNRSEIQMMLDDAMAMFTSGKKKIDYQFKILNTICENNTTQSLAAVIHANKQLNRIIILSDSQRIKENFEK